MTTSELKETAAVKPDIPTLDLREAQEVPRKKTFSDKVKGLKETVKRAVTPRSRSASLNEEELASAVAKKAKTESTEAEVETKEMKETKETKETKERVEAVAEKPSYAAMAKKATQAVKKTLGIDTKEAEVETKTEVETKAEEASRLSNESKKEKKGAVAGGVAGGVVAVGLLILGVVLSKVGAKSAKSAEPVVEKKKSFGFSK